MLEEHLILMRSSLISLCVLIRAYIEELVFVLAWTIAVLALYNVNVNYSNHSHSLGLVNVYASGKVSHLMNLDQRINIQFKFVYVRL